MEKDKRTKVEGQVRQLINSINSHDIGIQVAEDSVRRSAASRLAAGGLGEAEYYPQSGYYLEQTVRTLVAAWLQIVTNSEKVGMEAAITQYDFDSQIGQIELASDGKELRAAGAPVGRGTEAQIKSLKESFEALIKDVGFINQLAKLEAGRSSLGLWFPMQLIAQEVKPIVDAIDAEGYKTKAKCCPTIYRLAKDYFLG